MISYQNFVKENEEDLKNMFDILKDKIIVTLSFESFCRFCYEHTV